MRRYASVIGVDALALVDTKTSFIVHSIFNKGFNIVNGEDLIFIGTNENGDAPFSIIVTPDTRQQLISKINIGDTLEVKGRVLYGPDFTLNVDVSVLPVASFTLPEMQQLAALSFDDYEETDFTERRVNQLIEALAGEDATEELRYFIGRGSGLTPAGDDILVGIMFGHFIRPFITDENMQRIAKLMDENITTIVSKAYINAATRGKFNSRLTDLMTDPNAAGKLLTVGSSSGRDTAYGIKQSLKEYI